MNLAFFASHQGSNMQAVIDACKSGVLPARPCAVISNNRDSEALARAARERIPAYHLSAKTHPDPEALDLAILQAVQKRQAELIILAGFMRKLGPHLLAAYHNRILNIHPSLLPKYRGLDTHARAIAAGDAEAGCSVHEVTAELDGGPILGQARVPILPGDTPESLAARVLPMEQRLYPAVLRRYAMGDRRPVLLP